MDLRKEIDVFRDSFREGGVLTRIVLILGLFFSLSSLTSLSSRIVEWKGFILEGIKFYQVYFVDPIASSALNFGLSYSQIEIHTATVSSICVTVGMRILALGQQVAFREINKKYNSDLKPNLTIYWIMAIAYSIGIWLWYGISDPIIRPWSIGIFTVFYPAAIVLPKIILSKMYDAAYYEKNVFSYFKSYYAYLGALLLIVCVLAAINTGLKESEPDKSIQPTTNVPAD
jgi:hypothetical protein